MHLKDTLEFKNFKMYSTKKIIINFSNNFFHP